MSIATTAKEIIHRPARAIMAVASSSDSFLPYGLKKLLEQMKKQVSAKPTSSRPKRFKFPHPYCLHPDLMLPILYKLEPTYVAFSTSSCIQKPLKVIRIWQ